MLPSLPSPSSSEPQLATTETAGDGEGGHGRALEFAAVGLAALNTFLQANVTGPVLEGAARAEAIFADACALLVPPMMRRRLPAKPRLRCWPL